MLKIGINGFGRIGKLFFRLSLLENDIKVVAINDLISIEDLYHFMKYDSVHGNIKHDIELKENSISVNGYDIKISSEKNPKNIGWADSQVDLVIESTGIFLTQESAAQHIHAGASKVLLSAPSKDQTPMFVYGVNHNTYDNSMKIISNASCTTNCLAPIAKLINDNFGIQSGVMTTVHSATATQNVVDSISSNNRRISRGITNNIIPSTTGAAKAVGKVVPELNGILTGMAYRVPTSNVSVVDFSVNLKKSTSINEINSIILNASQDKYKGVIGYCDEDLVSADFNGDTRTSIYDKSASLQITPHFFKLVSWYDNETGYSHKLIEMARHMFKR
ncbi:MAG: type I glyceraldehyde-3-phosphate dehydrogenase [Flavobacteriales bacterium]|nr:type I glyceraldehyde-3-phosphate dehydrogenase [Flavobacteriales bacterium]